MWTFICTLARDVKKCARESICQCQTAGKNLLVKYHAMEILSNCRNAWTGNETVMKKVLEGEERD